MSYILRRGYCLRASRRRVRCFGLGRRRRVVAWSMPDVLPAPPNARTVPVANEALMRSVFRRSIRRRATKRLHAAVHARCIFGARYCRGVKGWRVNQETLKCRMEIPAVSRGASRAPCGSSSGRFPGMRKWGRFPTYSPNVGGELPSPPTVPSAGEPAAHLPAWDGGHGPPYEIGCGCPLRGAGRARRSSFAEGRSNRRDRRPAS